MGSLKEEAKLHQSNMNLSIADLEKVDVNTMVYTAEGKDQNGKPFSYKYIEIDGKQYRVPASVLSQIKDIISVRADVKQVKVKKTGSGLGTKYQVIAL